jgi:phage FluMu protein gp41
MERIRNEKQELSSLVKTLSETNVKSAPVENGLKLLREQLDEIIAINGELRKDNDGLKVMIDGLKLQIESQRMETRKYEDKIMQKQSIV